MENLKGNIFGGVTAAVVALPLALAFGVSSGAGAAAGIYGAIFVGFFAAVFGGTKTQISGPTGPMTVVMAVVITHFIGQSPEHGLAMAFTAVILGGLFQIIFGLLRIGKYIILAPYPVISGFMSGIGVIIIILQIGPFLGQPGGANVLSVVLSLPDLIKNPDMTAIMISCVTLAVVFLWPARLGKILPSPLAALFIGTVFFLIAFPDSTLDRIGEIQLGLPSFQMPYLDFAVAKDLITYGLLLAGLGAIDSLLTSLVADNMTATKHNPDRELIGQGIGNMMSGLFAALPGAGATMRTAVNINAGGTGRLSGVIHVLVLSVIVLGAGGLVKDIPYAVLAGILIKVGVDIIDWTYVKRLHRLPLFSQALMVGVLLMTVFYDLMTAVVLGVFVTNIVTVDRLTSLQLDGLFVSNGDKDHDNLSEAENAALRAAKGNILLFHLDGPMSYGVAHAMKQKLDDFVRHHTLIIDFSKASIVGITTALVIEDIIGNEREHGRTVYLTGLDDTTRKTFSRLDIFDYVGEGHVMAERMEAIELSAKA